MAAPHVSGVVALIASAYPNLETGAIKAAIVTSTKLLPSLKTKLRYPGIVSASKALSTAKKLSEEDRC